MYFLYNLKISSFENSATTRAQSLVFFSPRAPPTLRIASSSSSRGFIAGGGNWERGPPTTPADLVTRMAGGRTGGGGGGGTPSPLPTPSSSSSLPPWLLLPDVDEVKLLIAVPPDARSLLLACSSSSVKTLLSSAWGSSLGGRKVARMGRGSLGSTAVAAAGETWSGCECLSSVRACSLLKGMMVTSGDVGRRKTAVASGGRETATSFSWSSLREYKIVLWNVSQSST